MAFDGIVISAVKQELNEHFQGGRIAKIAQPEKDELLLTIKGNNGQELLMISANASLPLIYITDIKKQNPMTAPNFCMLLRKHIQGGMIKEIIQPDFERILIFRIEHRNDLGDLCEKKLIVEFMGKHSNIIFCDEKDMILDSIKHISAQVSSVREVLPGRTWFIPSQEGKIDPLGVADNDTIIHRIINRPSSVSKAIYRSFTGISPLMAVELCFRSGIDADMPCASLSESDLTALSDTFLRLFAQVRQGSFSPELVHDSGQPIEYAAFALTMYGDKEHEQYESISTLLRDYYSKKDAYTRIRQKSAELRHTVSVLLERTRKKYDLQSKQLKDTEKKDRYKTYGQMIQTWSWKLEKGMASFEEMNYETGATMKVPLDRTLTPMENAQKYFARYAKQKRTAEALSVQIRETKDDLDHLESVASFLDTAETEQDLREIREELILAGYIKKGSTGGKKKQRAAKSEPWHYILSDGFDAYIGRNNLQNDELTFSFAKGNDWWFHAKGIPGSHVIVKCPDGELPDRAFEEAARLAAYYSKGRESDRVEIDYIQKKHVKKPNKSKPGFVVYYTNYSMLIKPDISGLKQADFT